MQAQRDAPVVVDGERGRPGEPAQAEAVRGIGDGVGAQVSRALSSASRRSGLVEGAAARRASPPGDL
jgi:hypothetical protein